MLLYSLIAISSSLLLQKNDNMICEDQHAEYVIFVCIEDLAFMWYKLWLFSNKDDALNAGRTHQHACTIDMPYFYILYRTTKEAGMMKYMISY